jgi:hypothetical protein
MGELIGYVRCSTVLQDLTAQREALALEYGFCIEAASLTSSKSRQTISAVI